MRVGFVGATQGLTEAQQGAVRTLLELSNATELHHCDCGGANGQAMVIAAELGLRCVSHLRSHSTEHPCDEDHETYRARSYAERDADILFSTDLLLAAPDGEEPRRSGIWGTIRMACRAKDPRPHVIILPDGSVACGPMDTLACFLVRDAAIRGLLHRAEPLDVTGSRCLQHTCC